jgi:DNA replication initiation complex subunit (GINS family)
MSTSRLRRTDEHEEIQNIQEGRIAQTALGFSRQIAQERMEIILKRAFAEYRERTLTAEQSLTYFAQMVGLDDLRLALEQKVAQGNVSLERREGNGKSRKYERSGRT